MGKTPSLLTLCIEAITTEIIHGNNHHLEEYVFELPSDLYDCLFVQLPPLALHKLQKHLSPTYCIESIRDGCKNGRKRGRYGDFNTAWKRLYMTRWPETGNQINPVDHLTEKGVVEFEIESHVSEWHQMYWEAHLQDCLDKAAEEAMLPSFERCISDIKIPDDIMEYIGHKRCICGSTCAYSELSYHCQQYGCYARCLRLQSTLCVSETCDLLKGSKLCSLVLRRIKLEVHVYGACKLLSQNIETLSSLDFIYCRLSSTSLNAICESLFTRGTQTHGVKSFSIKVSSILESHDVSSFSGFLSFLSSGRSLCSLNLCDTCLGPNFTKTVLDTLLDVSSGLSVLDLSENNISGWLSNITERFSSCVSSSSKIGKSLWSLRVLNLRGNNLQVEDASSLKYCLLQMPNLVCLDISENPIKDPGLRSLIPYFLEVSERDSLLFDLNINSCELSCNGVAELLRSLAHMKALNVLSIANNDLGSEVGEPLGMFLDKSCVKVLNIEDIDLGLAGFTELAKHLPEQVKLIDINISKNRGGIECSALVSKLILQASELVRLNAGYNFIPSESLVDICSALKLSKGKLEQLDLTGNPACYQPTQASIFAEFQKHGRLVVICPTLPSPVAPYDDDV
ncbi:Leucine-rich repeat [Thalictrum thalictroides]|uniref:Leucine-rich repeat n=1 Tax=Thalictrum thalictroides TaxID=46969 RepID=A0A7J6UQM6_THATH|nr:Leucine-rich repeat [Thalictrum thalictroides]